MWILTVRPPGGETSEYLLKPGRTSIGRNPENDVVIPDESASRLHAELEYDPDGNRLSISDLGSTNGTFVNQRLLTRRQDLRAGDQIRIGEVETWVHDGEPKPVTLTGTHPLTRDLLLESVQKHAILLHKATQSLDTVSDLETALAQVSELMRAAMDAAKCELIPADRFELLGELGFPVTLAKQAIHERSVLIAGDVPGRASSQSAALLRIRSALCMPILRGDQVVALLYAYKTDPEAEPFDKQDVRLAVAAGDLAGLTIERMRILQLTLRDPLTNLFSRRYLEQAIEREEGVARQGATPVGIIMLDLDHFKSFNDRHGHAAGDLVLVEVARLLLANIRGGDVACRYGGEEFALMLPAAPLEVTLRRAEELRDKLSRLVVTPQGRALGAPSVSAGIAIFPEHAETLSGTLRAANAALQQAKQSGRDRICLAEPAQSAP